MDNLTPHPLCDAFPQMQEAELADLCQSVARAYDASQPVVLYEGKILDGRHRYLAAQRAGVAAPTVEFEGDLAAAVRYVEDRNLRRRSLTASQRAMVAAALEPYYARAAKERQRQGVAKLPHPQEAGKARSAAARAAQVSERYVQDAKKIAARSPEVAAQVRGGAVSIPEAKRGLKQRQAAGPAALLDKESRPVPERLLPAFGDERFQKALRHIASCGELVDQILAEPDRGAFICPAEFLAAKKNLYQIIKFARPHAVHSACGGAGCKDCRMTGWLPKLLYDASPKPLQPQTQEPVPW